MKTYYAKLIVFCLLDLVTISSLATAQSELSQDEITRANLDTLNDGVVACDAKLKDIEAAVDLYIDNNQSRTEFGLLQLKKEYFKVVSHRTNYELYKTLIANRRPGECTPKELVIGADEILQIQTFPIEYFVARATACEKKKKTFTFQGMRFITQTGMPKT